MKGTVHAALWGRKHNLDFLGIPSGREEASGHASLCGHIKAAGMTMLKKYSVLISILVLPVGSNATALRRLMGDGDLLH